MYSQDVPRHMLLKSVDVSQSYLKNKNVPSFFFEIQCIIITVIYHATHTAVYRHMTVKAKPNKTSAYRLELWHIPAEVFCNRHHVVHNAVNLLQNNNHHHPLVRLITIQTVKERSIETQTLRAGCSKAEPEIFASAADHLPGGTGRPKFNQLEMVTTFTYKPSLVRIDARNFELLWLQTHPPHPPTHTHTPRHTPTDRTDYNTLRHS